MSTKRSLSSLIDSLVDKDGIKTEVTVTITDDTVRKIIVAFLASGISVVLLHHLLKNSFPNKQLLQISETVLTIKKQLSK